MTTHDFLFELGCEELPTKSLTRLSQSLEVTLAQQFDKAGLAYQSLHTFASPRRLAILVSQLDSTQSAQVIERQGPSVSAAFDKDGTPTLACIGFARSCGVSTDKLKIKETPKGERLYCRVEQAGQATENLLAEFIANSLKQLPISKPMRWGSSSTTFIRPVHWITMLYGNKVIHSEYFGKRANNETYGHRFHHPKALKINQPRDYETLLQTHGMVIADVEKRKQKIRQQIEAAGKTKGKAIIDESLLNEVTALVEWPVALVGQFNPDFLQVPSEALITSMKVHQKCFPIVDNSGGLLPYFILVSNIESKDPNMVIKGNERVINARLSDAAFFYHNDLKQEIKHFNSRLSDVVFQKSLGTLSDRCTRLAKISDVIAKSLDLDSKIAKRAANLAKFDLMSDMVGEFPELQGVMGYYYANNADEDKQVALALKEQYNPQFSGDKLPTSDYGCILALADRLDLLVGILGINKIPTGEKDPYALKRAAQGIVRLLVEKSLPLDLHKLLVSSHKNFTELPNKTVVDQAFQFIMERMRSWYLEQGVAPELFAAVSAKHPTQLLDFDHRLKAVQSFQHLPESSALAAANKRVGNILKKSSDKPSKTINNSLFEHEIEAQLTELLEQKTGQVNSLYEEANYQAALSELATLKEPVDTFFDQVMIMSEDKKIRANRLALLAGLQHLFTQVADISLLP